MDSVKITILNAIMSHHPKDGYLGHVTFGVDGHKQPYELTLQSDRKPDDWNYSLHFAGEPGPEEEIDAVDRVIDEDDDVFDMLVEAAMEKLG